MKILITFFTRTENTKKVAEKLAERLGADIEELQDKKDRKGMLGYIIAGHDMVRKKSTEIDNIKYNPSEYDLVIIGTPVWVGTFVPAIKKYIEFNKNRFKKIAFFTTQGSERRQRVFDELKKETGKEPIAELQLSTKEVVTDQYFEKLEEFVKKLTVNN